MLGDCFAHGNRLFLSGNVCSARRAIQGSESVVAAVNERQGERSRRRRGSISRHEIVVAALRVLDTHGEHALTFAQLGKELVSAPTAVYRHFASRDDLILALGDHLDALSLAGYTPTDDWRADLIDLAWRAWRQAIEHPAASSIALGIVTNGTNELRAVESVLRALNKAGLHGRVAVVHYQVYSNLVLNAAAAHGSRLSRLTSDREWLQVYEPADPSQYPYATAAREDLKRLDYEEVFARQLEMFLEGVHAAAAADPVESSSQSDIR